jgi:hypothetical protein
MNHYSKDLDPYTMKNQWIEFYWNTRKWLFTLRVGLYASLFRFHYRFGFDFNLVRPGLEVKYACEQATKSGAELVFMGTELDKDTWNRMHHETRMNVFHYLWKRWQYA